MPDEIVVTGRRFQLGSGRGFPRAGGLAAPSEGRGTEPALLGAGAFLSPGVSPVIEEIVVRGKQTARPTFSQSAPRSARVPAGAGAIAAILGFLGAKILDEIGMQKLEEEFRELNALYKLPRNDTPLHVQVPDVIPEIIVRGKKPVPRLFRAPSVPFEMPLVDPLIATPGRAPLELPTRPPSTPTAPPPAPTVPKTKPRTRPNIPIRRPGQPLRRPSVPIRRPGSPVPRRTDPGTLPGIRPEFEPQTNPMIRPIIEPDERTDTDFVTRTDPATARPQRLGTQPGTQSLTGFASSFASPLLTPFRTGMATSTGAARQIRTREAERARLTRLASASAQSNAARNCPPCKKEKKKKEKARTKCWKKLVKEGRFSKLDTEYNWVRIDCDTGREL